MQRVLILIVALLLFTSFARAQEQWDDRSFPPATSAQKPWTRWWWMGSAVDRVNLSRELAEIQSAGFGGVEVTPLYGAVGFEDRYLPYLSPRWMDMLQFTAEEAHRRDLGVDMATGTGWPFGGLGVKDEDADAKLVKDDAKLLAETTKMKVKRAAPGGEGWVINPYSMTSMQKYLSRFDGAFRDMPRGMIRAQFHDSFEYAGNWQRDLPRKFKQMHGYDLAEHVDELWSNADDQEAAAVRHDYRATLAQMHLETMATWIDWSHTHSWLARNQSHGAPANLIDLYAQADIAETETFGSTPFPIPGLRREEADIGKFDDQPQPLVSRFASSAMHLTSKRVTSCESFTWLRDHFRASLAMMKPEADQMFLAGINHLVFHGTCYSPSDVDWPGWNFYASVEFNPRNPIWRDLPAMNEYLTRCQSMLQAGEPDNDVLLYFPFDELISQPSDSLELRLGMHTGFLKETSFAKTAERLIERGYGFDYVSDMQLMKLPTPSRYKVIVVPACRLMSPETFDRLMQLNRSGVAVIFDESLPTDVPGLAQRDERRAKLLAMTSAQQSIRIGPMETYLPQLDARAEPMTETGLRYIRRRNESGHHYFIANLTDHAIAQWFTIASPMKSAILLNPLTGQTGLAPTKIRDGMNMVYLSLQPGESIFLRTFADKIVQANAYPMLELAGDGLPLAGTWQVDFIEGGPDRPQSFQTNQLQSWTDRDDEQLTRFAGTARYTLDFDFDPSAATEWLLDLGDVRESARISLNGKPVGTLWSLPFQMPVGKWLKPGKNRIEIEVTNLAANRIRDLDSRKIPWKKFHEINFVNVRYEPFDASTWDIIPSGLIGPVQLRPMKPASMP